jgi:hypothetical protein
VIPALEIDIVSVHEEVIPGADPMFVVVPALDWNAVSVHEELLDDIARPTDIVTVSVSSTVVYEVTVLVVVTSDFSGVGNAKINVQYRFICNVEGKLGCILRGKH